ncbi:hypothetical protein SHM7688_03589 [Shimia marina]|uniref:Uncharacterized protein n=1 Tax=Shimia marina TaxID=321267 RepID=A0A0P1FBV8_9RHOB|nr:hypothetical protein SHM7688_03589 [Shimia marina]
MDQIRAGDGADFGAHPGAQLFHQLLRGLLIVHQGDIAIDALALDVMRIAHHGGLGHGRMGHKGAFHLRRAHAVAGDIDHIIHTAGDPIVAVFVAAAAVTGKVIAFVIREIGFLKALMIAPDRAHLARPAVLNAEHAFHVIAGDFLAGLRIQHHWVDAKEGLHRRAGFGGMGAGQGGHHMAAGLGLPPGVHDRAAAAADHVVVPVPGLRVDRLAHGAKDAQRRQVTFLHIVIALTHQRAQRGGRGIELIDAVFFADLPEARGIRIGRHALKHQRGRAIGQRPIDDIAVAGDPAHISGTPEDVAVFVIKGVFMGHGGIDQIAAGGMHHAFGLTGGA